MRTVLLVTLLCIFPAYSLAAQLTYVADYFPPEDFQIESEEVTELTEAIAPTEPDQASSNLYNTAGKLAGKFFASTMHEIALLNTGDNLENVSIYYEIIYDDNELSSETEISNKVSWKSFEQIVLTDYSPDKPLYFCIGVLTPSISSDWQYECYAIFEHQAVNITTEYYLKKRSKIDE